MVGRPMMNKERAFPGQRGLEGAPGTQLTMTPNRNEVWSHFLPLLIPRPRPDSVPRPPAAEPRDACPRTRTEGEADNGGSMGEAALPRDTCS